MTNKKNILVTGANGQLGQEFRQLEASYSQYNFLFTGKEDLPVTDTGMLESFFSLNKIDYCINCAAYTAVDKAESDKETALQVNADAVGHLARICKKYDTAFFHFSTDYVFDGNEDTPYTETSATKPVNFYGETKLRGELLAQQENKNTVIIRTSWVYSSHGKNFVKTMLKLMCEKENINVVNDQFGCPTYAADLAVAVLKIINSGLQAKGIYHYCNKGVISWYEFAIEIKKLVNSKCVVHAIGTSSYPTPAKRPVFSALDTTKIESRFTLDIPEWRQSLSACISLVTL